MGKHEHLWQIKERRENAVKAASAGGNQRETFTFAALPEASLTSRYLLTDIRQPKALDPWA